MFRGSNVDEKMSDEIISTADYLPIMCKLCDIPVDYEKIMVDFRLVSEVKKRENML